MEGYWTVMGTEFRKPSAATHKFISESVLFPDRTDRAFYESFNAEFLFSLGIIPEKALLGDLFEACSYLPWKAFDDTAVLHEIDLPEGIVSNFNPAIGQNLGRTVQETVSATWWFPKKPTCASPTNGFTAWRCNRWMRLPKKSFTWAIRLKLDMQLPLRWACALVLIDRDNLYNVLPRSHLLVIHAQKPVEPMKKLAIIGSGDLAGLIAYHVAATGAATEVVGYFNADCHEPAGKMVDGYPILGTTDDVLPLFAKGLFHNACSWASAPNILPYANTCLRTV